MGQVILIKWMPANWPNMARLKSFLVTLNFDYKLILSLFYAKIRYSPKLTWLILVGQPTTISQNFFYKTFLIFLLILGLSLNF